MEEGIFVEWLKAHGDTVQPGDVVFRLESEKSTEEVESLDAGLLHIPANGPNPGDTLAVGTVIGYLLQAGEAPPDSNAAARLQSKLVETPSPGVESRPTHTQERPDAPSVTPRARRLAARLGVNATEFHGSGRHGRIRERDVVAPATPQAAQTIPITPTRRTIAARMIESRQTAAPVTLTSIVDATNLVSLRKQFKAAASDEAPTFTDFFVKLVANALQKHPMLASRWTDAGIVIPASIDVGIAVDADARLLVPVIRDVPSLGLREVAALSRVLVDRARRGELTTRDMQGGCFTITNLGAFGIDAFTPIINPPQCAVLGMGRIERRPVMDGDRVVGRDMVTLSLTFDHRIVDGAPAARFLQSLAGLVADPAEWV